MVATPLHPSGRWIVRGIYRGDRISRVVNARTEEEAVNALIDQLQAECAI